METRYALSAADYTFCIELAKIGHVNIMSSQVTIIAIKGYSEGGLDFSKNVKNGINLPDNWRLEFAGYSEERKAFQITFKILS